MTVLLWARRALVGFATLYAIALAVGWLEVLPADVPMLVAIVSVFGLVGSSLVAVTAQLVVIASARRQRKAELA